MRLGELLVASRVVSPEEVETAMARQAEQGGRLGDNLVAISAISAERLESFLHRLPTEPGDIESSGIPEVELLNLMIKQIYSGRLESMRHFADNLRLPVPIVQKLVRAAIDRRLLRALGTRDTASFTDMVYALTDEGQRWAQEALQQSQYTGPAPVTLDEFCARVNLQKITNEFVTFDSIKYSLGDLTIADSFIEKLGPALNSGRALLLYGPPGNGKTSVALSVSKIFSDVIFVPFAVMVAGQIMRVFDPSFHSEVSTTSAGQGAGLNLIRQEAYDRRWVACRRPFVVTGGELTLEMLDLRYDSTSNFYEAPLHVKALGGCFIIDDFGRQLVSPTNLLNRWIMPLESRVDYLKLHTGKSFTVPFDELVIFSTNLEPEDLMDPAFLRRLPYKLEIGAPTRDEYRRIFEKACQGHGLTLTDDIFDFIVQKIADEKQLDLAGYHPRFIVDQIVATCRFLGEPPHFDERFVSYAVDNLRVHRNTPPPASRTQAKT
jgi:hypothetical protein